jgi:inosine triphosphate pyrophosphatase
VTVASNVTNVGPDIEPVTFVGQTQGFIVPARGPHSFGWDPIFEPEGTGQTYAEMDAVAKNKISHRCGAVLRCPVTGCDTMSCLCI